MSIIGLDFLSIYLSVHLSIHPSSYQALCIVCQTAVYLSVNISIYLSISVTLCIIHMCVCEWGPCYTVNSIPFVPSICI